MGIGDAMDATNATDHRDEIVLLRAEEVAELTKLGRSTVYELIASRTIPSIKFGRSVRVPLHALRRWIAEATA